METGDAAEWLLHAESDLTYARLGQVHPSRFEKGKGAIGSNSPLKSWQLLRTKGRFSVPADDANLGIRQWANNDQNAEPTVVMACCGDTPTLEILAAVPILHEHLTDLKNPGDQCR